MNSIKKLIRKAMKSELEAINEYTEILEEVEKKIKLSKDQKTFEKFVKTQRVIKDIIKEETRHIGEFETILTELDKDYPILTQEGQEEANKLMEE